MTVAATAPGTRRHGILTAALAVAIVAVGGSAAGTLVDHALASAPAVVAAPAPAAPAPAVPAPAAPAPAAVVDTGGRPLPAEAATGVGRLAAALSAGDPAAVRPLYAEGGVGAPWPQVEAVLADPAARAGLSTALGSAPERRSGVYVYQAGGFRLGVDPQGRLRFVQAP